MNDSWFPEARYGLFIHYGLYSLLERGEWVWNREAIPREEYKALASRFTEKNFDADKLCAMAGRGDEGLVRGNPRGREPKEPEGTPGPQDQVNFTNPESRSMPCGGKTNFEQAYNAQAGVEIQSRLIVTKRVSQAANDKQELVENVRAWSPMPAPIQIAP